MRNQSRTDRETNSAEEYEQEDMLNVQHLSNQISAKSFDSFVETVFNPVTPLNTNEQGRFRCNI